MDTESHASAVDGTCTKTLHVFHSTALTQSQPVDTRAVDQHGIGGNTWKLFVIVHPVYDQKDIRHPCHCTHTRR